MEAPMMGAAMTPLRRLFPAHYADGIDAPAGTDRPGARAISNIVFATDHQPPDESGLTDFFWQWGQFLDHDMDLTDAAHPAEPFDIPVPGADPEFDPEGSGNRWITFNRSIHDQTAAAGPRQQVNEITAWIDASNVYGSSRARALALRTLDGSGTLATSPGRLMPFNELGLPNAGGDSADLFLAGDVRANEHVGLTAMHTLFLREHNRRAKLLLDARPDLSGEVIYHRVRAEVAALMQSITYNEFLPALLGPDALPPYDGYDSSIDARVSNAFATAAYRFGHSVVSPSLLRLDAELNAIAEGPLPLRSAFFAPLGHLKNGGLEALLRGLAWQGCQRLDVFVIDDLRNFLFGAPGEGGFDLVSLNIQRGRDHGLPSYNEARQMLGMTAVRHFEELTEDVEVAQRLEAAYGDVEFVDLWVGGLAEPHLPEAQVGETFHTILLEQFRALRDGDRYWYAAQMSPPQVEELESIRLSDVIRMNTEIEDEIADDVFRLPVADQ